MSLSLITKEKSMENENNVVRNLCTNLGNPTLSEDLTKAAWRDVQPILIKVMRDRVANRNAPELVAEFENRSEFYGVSGIDQRELHEFVGHFYSVLPEDYEVPELAPITPFGLNALLSHVSQDVSLTSIRTSEVVSDPTTPLALYCAYLRKQMLPDKTRRYEPARLATMHRVLRLQPFDRSKGYMQHFRLLGLCSGGRDSGHSTFFIEHVIEHVSIWLDLINRLQRYGYSFKEVEVKISDMRVAEALIKHHDLDRSIINLHSLDEEFNFLEINKISFPKEAEMIRNIPEEVFMQHGLEALRLSLKSVEERALQPLRDRYPKTRFAFDFARKAGLGYYEHLCYHVFAKNKDGRRVQLADGGSVDWLAKLLMSKKERMVTSGFGCELVQNLFRPVNYTLA